MRFDRFKSKLKNFYAIFIAPPKLWKLPKKSEILIYDACGAEALMPYLSGYGVEIIPLRRESVNVPCLLRAILKLSFWRGNPIQAYADTFIQAVSPKVVITFIDNNPAFYAISNRFPEIKTIFFQNGTRIELGDVFGFLDKSESHLVDYMLVHGSAIGKHYQKFISGQAIACGSLKSNHVRKSVEIVAGTILFISQYCDKPKGGAPFLTAPDGTLIFWDQFFMAEVQVLNFLNKWCAENNKALQICGRGIDKEGSEKYFYDSHLKGCEWKYISKSEICSSYSLVDSAEIVVFIDSTLGYESIGRGKKTACFSCRGTSLNTKDTKFGWPLDLPENGPFWTNDADDREFRRVMDYLVTISAKEWEKVRQFYASELMEYDAKNTRFVTLLDQLLSKSENLNHAQ
jgi:surface carbohydrate biosynthesis protein